MCKKNLEALHVIQSFAEWMCREIQVSKNPLEERSIQNMFLLMKGNREKLYGESCEPTTRYFCLLMDEE